MALDACLLANPYVFARRAGWLIPAPTRDPVARRVTFLSWPWLAKAVRKDRADPEPVGARGARQ